MKQMSARAMRKELIQGHKVVDLQLIPAVNALIDNEKIAQDKIANLESFTRMTFRQRVNWLLKGVQ